MKDNNDYFKWEHKSLPKPYFPKNALEFEEIIAKRSLCSIKPE